MISIDTNLYTRIKRDTALDILEQAHISPDKFTAHRDGTFTARYNKDRLSEFDGYEARIELIDNRVAIFKRPSKEMDRGRYITLVFAVADTEELGINGHSHKSDDPKHESHHISVIKRLDGVARDMRQLVNYAQKDRQHLDITLAELKRQVEILADNLEQLK